MLTVVALGGCLLSCLLCVPGAAARRAARAAARRDALAAAGASLEGLKQRVLMALFRLLAFK